MFRGWVDFLAFFGFAIVIWVDFHSGWSANTIMNFRVIVLCVFHEALHELVNSHDFEFRRPDIWHLGTALKT